MCQLLNIKTVFVNRPILTFARRFSDTLRNIEYNAEDNLDPKNYLEFKKYLRNNKVPYKDGHTCLLVDCKLCGRENKEAYVNKRTSIFLCPSCDVKKNISTVLDFYDRGKLSNVKKSFAKEEYQSVFSKEFSEIKLEVCENLKIRGLEIEDLNSIGAQYAASSDCLSIQLKNAAGKIVGEKVLHITTRKEETFPSANCSGLLKYGPTNKNKAIIVSNVWDFLVLLTQRMDNYCIICLPYFLNTLPQECLPGLERFKELVLWFNFDSTDWDVAKNFSRKLNENRCFLIRPTDTEPAPSEAYRRRLNLRHILHKATAVRHKSITTFEYLKNDVLSELQNIEKVNGVKWKRFPILNSKLKGHRKGELTILTGPTGSGKTTFMSEYSLDLALQGVTTLWGSFEIRNTRLAATLLRQFVGYSLEKKLNEFEHWTMEFQKYPLFFMTFQGQQPLKVVMEAIEHAQYIHDINHVIIDNLQFMMGTSGSNRTDKFWEQDNIIAAFRTFATKTNVHVTLVMHPRKERDEEELTTSSVFGSAKATQEADNVLIIQDKRLTSVRGKKYLQIAKNRYSGDLGVMLLEFDKESLSYSTNNKKKKEKDKDK